MRIVSIVGARPQFIKLSVISRAAAERSEFQHTTIHTGQHYEDAMSEVFFRELRIPKAEMNLGVGSGPHGAQTGEIMKRLEPALIETRPDWVLVYGDTNSTLAGATVAAKLHLPVAHIEAGLRSFNRRMPEEVNRIVADHLADILCCPTQTAVDNLRREGLEARAVRTGDVMYDASLFGLALAEQREFAELAAWRTGEFALATLHRAENTDDVARLRALLEALDRVAIEICPVVLPLHPRTRKAMDESLNGWTPRRVRMIPPLSYLEMLQMESRARLVLTDSGGVQKEAYFAARPCITLRDETEWVETLDHGCNALAGCDVERILTAARNSATAGPWSAIYGDGRAGHAILDTLRR
jgi:UDP-GlcNAc3NAcA epimerase